MKMANRDPQGFGVEDSEFGEEVGAEMFLQPELQQAELLKGPLVRLGKAAERVQKIRIAAELALIALDKQGQKCSVTEELHHKAKGLEDWLNRKLKLYLQNHPTYPWLSRINGTGGPLMARILAEIEGFGRFYELDDPKIPEEARRKRKPVVFEENGREVRKIWVEGIERLSTPAKLKAYAGLTPESKKEKGARISYNSNLKTLLWLLGEAFARMYGRYGNKYFEFCLEYKKSLEARLLREGYQIRPTPRGRYCPKCEEEVMVKAARFCPRCGTPLDLKKEPERVIYRAHLEAMARRRMLQLFLCHLWDVWRKAEGLPVRTPYPIERLGHSTVILPEEMIDKDR